MRLHLQFKIWKDKGKNNKKKAKGTASDTKLNGLPSPEVSSQPKGSEIPVTEANMLKPSPTAEDLTRFVDITELEYQDYGVYTGIVNDPTAKGGRRYVIIEPTLTAKDRENFETVRKILMVELKVDLNEIKTKKDAEERLEKKMVDIIDRYGLDIPRRNVPKLVYYAIRDFVHLGKLEPFMHDHMIEEISCDGTNIPLYIYHRKYESMPSNVIFTSDRELENFALKLAYVCGKHISIANPIVDASLPDGSRINLTLGYEVTRRGTTFTIRKFKADPITVIDLIKFNTMSTDIAAYLWYLVEKRLTMLVAGGTASGKTTTLNTLATFIPPGAKIVSIEDTAELNLPHENWIPAVSRQAFTAGAIGEITQFDLLRAALRQRPDIIIVGETRGREAYTLFQAMATGHGGFSSIHADSVSATMTRLTSAPMKIPQVLIVNTLDAILLQLKLKIGNTTVRRVIQVSEIAGLDEKSGEVLLNDVFRWNPATDRHVFTGRSVMFDKIAARFGETQEHITYELNKRKTALEWMVKNDLRKHKDVTQTILEFYANPERFYERKRFLV